MMIMTFQDEQEIDEWFDEEKELYSQRLMKQLETKKDFRTAQKQFNKEFKHLLLRLDREYHALDTRRHRQETLSKPLNRFKRFRKTLSLKYRSWKKKSAERWKKRRLDREYRDAFQQGFFRRKV